MNKTAKKFVTILGSVAMLGALLMVGGCGDDSSPSTVKQTNTIPAAGTTNGVTQSGTGITNPLTAPAITAKNSAGVTVLSIPPGVTITPPATATAFIAATPPTIGVTTYNNVAAFPATKSGAVFATVAGSIGLEFDYPNNGAVVPSPVTFSAPVTITIPLSAAVTSCSVFVNKLDGNGYVAIPAAQVTSCTSTSATISVTSLCTYIVNPTLVSGSTGSGF
jgi:hypothetical protein